VAEALGVGDHVDLDDLAARDREGHDRKRPSTRRRQHTRGAVHQHRAAAAQPLPAALARAVERKALLQQLDQAYWYKSTDDYLRWAEATLKAERATIERVGLLAK